MARSGCVSAKGSDLDVCLLKSCRFKAAVMLYHFSLIQYLPIRPALLRNFAMRRVIHTDLAPAAIGTYSQAIQINNTVYLSGQIGLDPVTMQLVEGIEAQIRRVFDNLKAVVEAAGGTLADMAKLNIFMLDLSHFQLVNQIMAEYFTDALPARAALGVASLPRGALVEMDGVLELPSA